MKDLHNPVCVCTCTNVCILFVYKKDKYMCPECIRKDIYEKLLIRVNFWQEEVGKQGHWENRKGTFHFHL